MKSLLGISLLLATTQAQTSFENTAEFLADFLPACKDDTYCESGTCLTNGRTVNGDPEYYFCAEPDRCDPGAPRSIDGICNNLVRGRRLRGSTGHSQLVRINNTFSNLQSPRVVSDVSGAYSPTVPNTFGASTLLVMLGQFIDHDITIIHLEPAESKIIPGSGIVPDMLFQPSERVGAPGVPPFFINDLTSYVDLSPVYGSDSETARILRAGAPLGELASRMIDGQEYLPFVQDLPPSLEEIAALGFLPESMAAGDIRVNEHLMLIAWHTIFMREHNRLARQFRLSDASLSDEELFQEARRWNIAQYQNIVFGEYFEAWHREPLPVYTGYDPDESPDVDIWFSTASYRFGHSGVPDVVLRIDENGNEFSLPLGEVFFRPSQVTDNGGVDALFNGATQQCHERIDTYFQDGLRNALFNDIPGLSGSPAMDLYTLNVARARDHQIGSYTEARRFFNLPVPTTFDEVTGNRECVTRLLEQLYGVDQVQACDPFVCGLAEPATRGELGQLFYFSQQDHFRRFRDADRFYFENTITEADAGTPNDPEGIRAGPGFLPGEIAQIQAVRIHDIIARNTFLQNDNANAPNYVNNAFTTTRCCRSNGNPQNSDQMCVPNGSSEQFILMENLAQCVATDAVRNGEAFYPGSPECDCNCFCPMGLAALNLAAVGNEGGGMALGMGAMIGIIVAVVAVAICGGVGGWVFYKRRKEARELDYTQSDQMSIASGASHSTVAFAKPASVHSSVHSAAPAVNNYF